MKKYITFKDLAIGDKFRVKGGRNHYTKITDNSATTIPEVKWFPQSQTVEKL